jgi:hypothetical protein
MQMAWPKEEWMPLITLFGVLAATGGAFFVYWQIRDANKTLFITNSYTVQKDILDAADQLSEAIDEVTNPANGSNAASLLNNEKRQATKLDGLIDTVHAVRNNNGISNDTWEHILRRMCPAFDPDYKAAGVLMSSVRSACTEDPKIWQGVSH